MPSPYRLLLVSMSGVRIKNRRLLDAGMTLPGFVERSEVIASLPSLGLLALAAYTPDHWDITYSDLDALGETEYTALRDGGYGLIAISFLTARAYDTYELADRLRNDGQTVVLGGLHVSMMADEAAQHADSVVIGEGESCWPQLIADFEKGKLQPRYASAGQSIPSFADGPVPRYDLLDLQRYNRITLQTTRGCPLHCHFCGASHLISPVRRKAIGQVRRELDAIVARWPHPFIELADDNTFVNKSWGKELLRLFAEYPIRWFTETDISVAADAEMLELLAASNCAQLLIGLESPSKGALSGMDPARWKAKQHDKTKEAVQRIQSYGISVNGCFILGSDEDDADCFDRTADYINSLELAEAQITLLTPFPGTALYHRLQTEQRLLKPDFWDACTLFDVTFQPKHMSVAQLEDGFFKLMQRVYSDERVQWRKALFRDCTKTRFQSRTTTKA